MGADGRGRQSRNEGGGATGQRAGVTGGCDGDMGKRWGGGAEIGQGPRPRSPHAVQARRTTAPHGADPDAARVQNRGGRAAIQTLRAAHDMPEGPEVQRSADLLHQALAGRTIRAFGARTKAARAWLAAHPGAFEGKRVEKVWAHGKHLVGQVEDGLFFHSHYLMWGRWMVLAPDADEVVTRDRRERARIVTDENAAILFSAPKFTVGRGDPYQHIPALPLLGPDVLPEVDGAARTVGAFDADEFLRRLDLQPDREIGSALLDQSVAAGIGNYLRAEILYACRMDPWRHVGEMDADERACLAETTARLCLLAYREGGRTVPLEVQERQAADRDLRYSPHVFPWNTKHWIFRRTNLPCLTCDDHVRQAQQLSHEWTDAESGDTVEKKRVIYFCPTCQGVAGPHVKKARPHKDRRPADSEWAPPEEAVDPDYL